MAPSRAAGPATWAQTRRWVGGLVAIAALAGSGGEALAATTTLTPAADAKVLKAQPNSNFGTSSLAVKGGVKAAESYLRFSLPSLPGPVTAAKLRLYATESSKGSPAVYATAPIAWSESSLTWANRPGTGAYASSVSTVSAGTWHEWDVTAVLPGSGTAGLVVKQSSSDDAVFHSKETSSSHPPQLVLTYSDGSCAACDDGNACTIDGCSSGGCTHTATGGACELDGNLCTEETCQYGSCAAFRVKSCDDGDACTSDTCVPATGACQFTLSGGSGCTSAPGMLVPWGSVWKYRDDGVYPGSGWTLASFADGAWKSGAGELGYGDGDEKTVVSYGPSSTSKYITTWFRKTFSLTAVPSGALTLRLRRDDGGIVYLNGGEVLRVNLPTGAIGPTTLATTALEDDEVQTVSVPVSRLVAGTNVLAVEMHQAAASSSDLSFDLQLEGGCVPTQTVEAACNGLDDDCDGLTDWLLPLAENACTTAAMGACGQGFAACLDGARTCLTPPPVAEARNGKDDDCDGQIDEAGLALTASQALRVAVPPYMWTDSPGLVDGVVETLAHVGVPVVAPTAADPQGVDWQNLFATLSNYRVIHLPGYVDGSVLSQAQVDALQQWVQGGGVLVLGKPSGSTLLALAGLSGLQMTSQATRLRFSATVPAALWLDSVEERDYLLTDNPAILPMNLHTYTLAAGGGAQAFATAYAGQTALGPSFVRRPLGAGAVYTFGLDLLSFTSQRCYVNCFDPGRDVYALLLKGVHREALAGHTVLKHTAPGNYDGVVLVTHDVDAPDAYNSTDAGSPGARRMAAMEAGHAVQAAYFFTTDYVTKYYVPAIVSEILSYGQVVGGAHSVQHLSQAGLPLGVCSVTKATYNPSTPTLCGEVVVSLQQVELASGLPALGFRAPYLSVHDEHFPVLAAEGVLFDASLAVGDTRTNFPVSAVREPSFQYKFQRAPLYTFPMNQEDGLGAVVDGTTSRTELQPAHLAQFLTRWKHALLHNQANQAWSVLLVHPSYGVDVPPENLQTKIDAVDKYLQFAKTRPVLIDDLVEAGQFWRGRDGVRVQATWTAGTGYSGQLLGGTVAAPRLTLEFGDKLASFTCAACGPVALAGRRVTLTNGLPAGAAVSFSAVPQ